MVAPLKLPSSPILPYAYLNAFTVGDMATEFSISNSVSKMPVMYSVYQVSTHAKNMLNIPVFHRFFLSSNGAARQCWGFDK